jgi:cyclase
MSIKRIIPVLLLKDDGLVKTLNFSNSKYIGDPINVVKIFSEKEADEIIILDILASLNNKINFNLLSKIFGECFTPITYGGGINSLDDAKKIVSIGAEKICVQSCFFDNKKIIEEIINHLGSQAVVLSIDIKKDIFGNYKIWNYKTKKFYKEFDLIETANRAIELGVGEIIFTDVDKEGTMEGTNKNLLKEICKITKIPIIFNGGIKDINDIKSSFNIGIDALGVSSYFVFYGKFNAVLISYPTKEIKEVINE